jgi:hypothetical protein
MTDENPDIDMSAEVPAPDPGNADPASWTEEISEDEQAEVRAALETTAVEPIDEEEEQA